MNCFSIPLFHTEVRSEGFPANSNPEADGDWDNAQKTSAVLTVVSLLGLSETSSIILAMSKIILCNKSIICWLHELL